MTILCRSFGIWSSLMSSVIGAQIYTCEWEPNSSLWRRAKARNVSLFTLYGGLFTFSTQLSTLIYLSRKATGSTWGNQFKDHRIAKLNKCKFLNFCNTNRFNHKTFDKMFMIWRISWRNWHNVISFRPSPAWGRKEKRKGFWVKYFA